MEIRSHFFLRVRSNLSGSLESQTKSISYFGCARAIGIGVPSISTERQINSRRRRGTSHFASERMNMAARLWLACASRAYAQPSLREIEQVSLHCHPERSEAESKGRIALPYSDATGFLDFARNNRTYMSSGSTKLEDLSWIPRPRLLALRRLGIESTEDLLTHFPRRHEDRTEFPRFPREETDAPICLCGEVTKTSLRRFGGWKKIFEATLEESQPNALSEPLICRWFNLHYVQKMVATGQRIVVFGKPRLRGKRICMDHPEFEVIENDEEISIHFRRITPIYPATEGLSQRVLRGIIYRVLHEFPKAEWQPIAPTSLVRGERSDAIRAIHFPE